MKRKIIYGSIIVCILSVIAGQIYAQDQLPGGSGKIGDTIVKSQEKGQVKVNKEESLSVETYKIQKLSDKTSIGKQNDVVITIIGKGFVMTEHNPVLVIGKMHLTEVYNNEENTQLYFVLSGIEYKKLVAQGGFEEAYLLNADGKKAKVKISKPTKSNSSDLENATSLSYTKYGVTSK